MRYSLSCLLVILLASAYPTSVSAQIPVEWAVVAASAGTDCGEAPTLCSGDSYLPGPGVFDAFVYCLNYPYYELQECVLGLTWPADWQLLTYDICAGTPVLVSTSMPGRLDVQLVFSPCIWADTAILHVTLDATTTGRLALTPTIDDGFYFKTCDSEREQRFYSAGYVDVGNICGTPLSEPCDGLMMMFGHNTPAADFSPDHLIMQVHQGQADTASVEVYTGAECYRIAECGGYGFPVECYRTPEPRVEWLTLQYRGSPGPDLARFDLRVDAGSLVPGEYDGFVEVEGGFSICSTGCCESACLTVRLEVLPPLAVEESTWGRIKTDRGR